MKRVFVRHLSLALAAIMAMGTVLAGCGKDEMVATTMRLLKTEGVVKLEVDGEKVDFTENQRLSDGNALITEAASMAAVGLDDYKTVTMDELSRAEFYKDGKNIQLIVTEGSAFFRVDKALEADETMYVGQPNMMVGIRGTAGTICKDAYGRPTLVLIEGEIEVEAVNPNTQERKKIKVKAPVKLEVFYYDKAEPGHTVEFSAVEIKPDQLDQFTISQIVYDEQFMNKIAADTDWSVEEIKRVGNEVAEGSYKPQITDPVLLGLMEPDDLALKAGITGPEEDSDDDEPGLDEPEAPDEEDEDEDEEPSIADEPQRDARTDNNAAIAREIPSSVRGQIVSVNPDGTFVLASGELFDPAYYLSRNPELAGLVGTDSYKLLEHYLNHGKGESRYANAEAEHQAALKKIEEQRAAELWQKEQDDANKKAAEAGGEDEGGDGGSTPQADFAYTILGFDGQVVDSGRKAAGETYSLLLGGDYTTVENSGGTDATVIYGQDGRTLVFTMPSNDVTIQIG